MLNVNADTPGPERPPDRRRDGIPVDDQEHEGDRTADRVHMQDVRDLTHVEDVLILDLTHVGENGVGDHQNHAMTMSTTIMIITTTRRDMKRTTTIGTGKDLALPVSSQVCQTMGTKQVPLRPAATRRIRKEQETHQRKENDPQRQLRKRKRNERDSVPFQKKRRESGH